MVDVGKVNGDSSTLQSLFTNYTSYMESVDNDAVWQGASKNNGINLANNFVSEYKSNVIDQLTNFASALNKYQDYVTAKQNKSTYESAAYNATDDDDKAYYRNKASGYATKMSTLATEINSLLSSVVSARLESAVSTVDSYKNLVTLNDFVNYFQGDYRNYSYGSSGTIASSGCGPTSMAMILTYLTGETVTPVDAASYALQHGYRIPNNGTAASMFPAMAKEYGITAEGMSPSVQNIVNSLREGKVIIAHMGPGTFTSGGHYIVLKGITEDGKVIVADPASRERTDKAYDPSIITRESAAQMYTFTV